MDQEHFLQFAHTLPEAMLLVSGAGRIMAANRAATDCLELEHLVGARLADVVLDAPDRDDAAWMR